MNRREKLLLVELLLRDIRGNWNWENGKTPRHEYAMQLCEELGLEKHVDRIIIHDYQRQSGDADGRIFRCRYDYGGYEDMEALHGLKSTIMDKSEEFREKAIEFLVDPDTGTFDDWGDYRESQGWERDE